MQSQYERDTLSGTWPISPRLSFSRILIETRYLTRVSGNIVSTFQVGCIFGSLFTFPLVEKYGRKNGMILASMVFCLGASIMVESNPRQVST